MALISMSCEVLLVPFSQKMRPREFVELSSGHTENARVRTHSQTPLLLFFFFNIYVFIYLAVSGLSCGPQDLLLSSAASLYLWCVGSGARA